MGDLIDDLLAFSKLGRSDIVKTTIRSNELVKEVIDGLEPGHHIAWNIQALPDIKGDLNTIRQVWINLISNAIKFSAESSKIILNTEVTKKQIKISVIDEGIGMSEEDKKHLSKLISENNLILMGGNTYALAKPHMKLKEGKLRVVVTHRTEEYSADEIKGQLEFVSGEISGIVSNLEKRGFGQMLLLSGENLNKEFFKENLIDGFHQKIIGYDHDQNKVGRQLL